MTSQSRRETGFGEKAKTTIGHRQKLGNGLWLSEHKRWVCLPAPNRQGIQRKGQAKRCVSFFFFFFCFLGPYLQHMEVSRRGTQSVLQLSTYATATAKQDLSRCLQTAIPDPYPTEEARDRTRVLMGTSGLVNAEPQWELQTGYNGWKL